MLKDDTTAERDSIIGAVPKPVPQVMKRKQECYNFAFSLLATLCINQKIMAKKPIVIHLTCSEACVHLESL